MLKRTLLAILILCVCTCSSSDSDNPGLSNNACGTIGLNTRVINGTECVGLTASPIVRINTLYLDGTVGACTGTMLTQTEVLTAGHCILDFTNFLNDPVSVRVVVGEEGNTRSISANGYAYHSDLRREINGNEMNIFNDIGVVFLDEPAGLPVLPILVSSTPQVGDVVQIYGYGQSQVGVLEPPKDFEEFLIQQAKLRSGEMLVSSVTPNHLRAEFLDVGSMVCRGDSGGPLVYTYNNEATVVGVTSELTSTSDVSCGEGATAQWTRLQSPEILNELLALIPNAQTR